VEWDEDQLGHLIAQRHRLHPAAHGGGCLQRGCGTGRNAAIVRRALACRALVRRSGFGGGRESEGQKRGNPPGL